MELNPLPQARRLSWSILHLSRTAEAVHHVIELVVPSEHVKALLKGEEERAWQKEAGWVRGIGELRIAWLRGDLEVDPAALDTVIQAVTAGEAGVEIEDVFDPHTAQLLRQTTPALAAGQPHSHEL